MNGYSKYVKFKAYIVTKEFFQIPREDFVETFPFVAKLSILHVFLALATHLNSEIY